jgi:hypothetical protein
MHLWVSVVFLLVFSFKMFVEFFFGSLVGILE